MDDINGIIMKVYWVVNGINGVIKLFVLNGYNIV